MPHPVVHFEIRSKDPRRDAGLLRRSVRVAVLGRRHPGLHVREHGGARGDPGRDGVPVQGGSDAVVFFVGVDDVEATLSRAEQLGGRTVQPATEVPGVTFGLLADGQGHVVGVAAM